MKMKRTFLITVVAATIVTVVNLTEGFHAENDLRIQEKSVHGIFKVCKRIHSSSLYLIANDPKSKPLKGAQIKRRRIKVKILEDLHKFPGKSKTKYSESSNLAAAESRQKKLSCKEIKIPVDRGIFKTWLFLRKL